MIKLGLLLERAYSYGCVMAGIDDDSVSKILDFNYKTISEEILFVEGDEYGREKHPHCTVKYGLTQSYSEDQMRSIIQNVTPFQLEIKGVSIFENEKFDVVKFDVDGPELRRLNEVFSRLPNHDQYPVYHPHMTLAYVRKGMGKKFARTPSKFAKVPVKTLIYSDRGNKMYFNL
jgi:hypothetical protein